ncbi:MAG: DegT/DnrJ/EryC1/StrS family aminotransferase [Magnetococcales bacterium]|nr:DegT/DnrJ/EryC1/StrS family aminotransferase [Magnetococcales bacterium]MBF0149081.1 DegT/DnrJ/EryC1/StrS family aminotransferase [Magnetococcales bacterium]MBF0172572.1 DegT/DnrJ/EryC1/StrS family aminotransferase [Magnetococcales bacterium]MBF0347141.1 DegT/DnrJ/EryC1/StrS family aminotransferase [Magnetococcales bacterium]MBF0630215.1 DegT/DnrJ/EryC1/StrS family aminotransferase [Magnetococcales bacterium]
MSERTVIPLVRPDLTRKDLEAVGRQMVSAPFRDDALVDRWESMWAQIWRREAILFDDPVDAVVALKEVLGWRDGVRVAAGAGMHPAWREGFAAAWIRVVHHDTAPQQTPVISSDGGFAAVFVEHFQGIPIPVPVGQGVVLEDLSSMPLPLPGTGEGAIQLMLLDGNAMIQGGNAALILCREGALASRFREYRTPPSGLVAALGMSQLEQRECLLQRRTLLASRYRAMRSGGWFKIPSGTSERWWHGFHLMFEHEAQRDGLMAFLRKGGILAGPAWPFSFPEVENMACRRQLERLGLALPLYASLTDAQQKRIINRIHRWVGRNVQ